MKLNILSYIGGITVMNAIVSLVARVKAIGLIGAVILIPAGSAYVYNKYERLEQDKAIVEAQLAKTTKANFELSDSVSSLSKQLASANYSLKYKRVEVQTVYVDKTPKLKPKTVYIEVKFMAGSNRIIDVDSTFVKFLKPYDFAWKLRGKWYVYDYLWLRGDTKINELPL